MIDPNIPPEGISVQGEKIKAPSDEVLELKAKNPTAVYLVRFFDGRRTWYVFVRACGFRFVFHGLFVWSAVSVSYDSMTVGLD